MEGKNIPAVLQVKFLTPASDAEFYNNKIKIDSCATNPVISPLWWQPELMSELKWLNKSLPVYFFVTTPWKFHFHCWGVSSCYWRWYFLLGTFTIKPSGNDNSYCRYAAVAVKNFGDVARLSLIYRQLYEAAVPSRTSFNATAYIVH